MGMKYRDPETGQFKDLKVKTSDTLPIGTIVEYDGINVPSGWEKVETTNIMQICLADDQQLTLNNVYELVKFDTMYVSVGDRLIFDSTNHGIKIGENVSKIKLHVELSMVMASENLIYLRVETSTGQSRGCNIRVATGFRGKASMDVYLNVSKNELIQLKTYGTTSDVITSGVGFTNLTVEVIE